MTEGDGTNDNEFQKTKDTSSISYMNRKASYSYVLSGNTTNNHLGC